MEKDLNNLTKEDLILKIKQLQQEKKLKRKYGLVWDTEKEPEQVVESCKNNIPILKNIKSKDIKTDNSQDNILIEGDNYHALQVLNYTHKNKIDVIYIDPPYNTGNKETKDFLYNDKFVDKEDAYRHSKWLNFISKRLELAKNLLVDNGVIFISIDDNEQANLKLLCDKIFGEDNFICNIIWGKKSSAKGVPPINMIVNAHEYIVVYKKKDNFKFKGIKRNPEKENFKNPDNDPRGPWRESNIKSTTKSLEEAFTITNPNNGQKYTNTWAFSKESLEQMIKENRILWKKNLPKQKEFLFEMTNENKAITTTWGVYDAQSTTVFLKHLIPNKKFNNPKPLELIKFLMRVSSEKNDTILDFFAGSGTTGHAVLDLNRQDGGNRKFILCTNNENNICSDVCYPRIQKIIKGNNSTLLQKDLLYEEKLSFNKLKNIEYILNQIDEIININETKYESFDKKLEDNFIKIYGENKTRKRIEGLGGNLKYFKTELIPIERIDKITDSKRKELTKKAGEIIGIKEDTLQEIEINNYYQILSNNTKTKFTAIYFRENEIKLEELINKIRNKKTVLYVFSYGKVDRKMYKQLSQDISIEDIPQPILDIYKELNLKFED